ncbi:3(2),5-bisphosphate nucleotidase HAL2 [Coniophora puteana RWD-64-598 SS2]|uniref:3'(2'),5'-bisphosphate nucleotidase n=1 Tax=Coniophora puteana (strain RWD-64-598) TaxID=741705 RepID=A0A5M3MEM5_CONPW|nr:3(2),5-bisphosphate nucleotidase HAL2 [Coniophora puteana RWD-64-598 SS2]EIW77603.1 3(2),5-bisphosphate nucleotidase HAL2 [Coniophora puteana RWD-64-598 SS2]
MSSQYDAEKQVAICAVRRACGLTSTVFKNLERIKGETLTKDDKSPVTVGDFAAQALVNTILKNAFPDDVIVGEEDSADLRPENASQMRARVAQLANDAITAPLVEGEDAAWGLGPGKEQTETQLLDTVDRGNHQGGVSGRMWTLDPIDGTKGFILGEQYAVCLALIVNGQVKLGVIGCPNLPNSPHPVSLTAQGLAALPDDAKGGIFVGIEGGGAWEHDLQGLNPKPIKVSDSPQNPRVLESREVKHSDKAFNVAVYQRITGTTDGTIPAIPMDSQAKYCALARGDGDLYLRMPVDPKYKEKIWDHAAGNVLVTEAGGKVTDSRGQLLNFGLGRTLGENYGIVGAVKSQHADVVKAVQGALEAKKATAKA